MNSAILVQRTVNCVKVTFPTCLVSTTESMLLQTLQSNFSVRSATTCSFRSVIICLASTTTSPPSSELYFWNMSNTTSFLVGRETDVTTPLDSLSMRSMNMRKSTRET